MHSNHCATHGLPGWSWKLRGRHCVGWQETGASGGTWASQSCSVHSAAYDGSTPGTSACLSMHSSVYLFCKLNLIYSFCIDKPHQQDFLYISHSAFCNIQSTFVTHSFWSCLFLFSHANLIISTLFNFPLCLTSHIQLSLPCSKLGRNILLCSFLLLLTNICFKLSTI